MGRIRPSSCAALLAIAAAVACTRLVGLDTLNTSGEDAAATDGSLDGDAALDASRDTRDTGGATDGAADGTLEIAVDTMATDVPTDTPADTPTDAGPPSSCVGAGVGVSDCADGESCSVSNTVTGGTFRRSADATAPATISTFRLDRYEVTVGRFRKFVDAVVAGYKPTTGGGKHAHLNGGSGLAATGGGYEPGWDAAFATHVPSIKSEWDTSLGCNAAYQTWTAGNDKRPINCLNWYQAYAFCIWDGGFLPSEAEWEYAAAGGSAQRVWPWGDTSPPSNASLAVYGCHFPVAGASCSGVTNIAPVGSVPAGAGLFKQLDLAGNFTEWALDWHLPYVAACVDCANFSPGATTRVIRGGDLNDGATMIQTAYRTSFAPANRSTNLGFRCARSP